MIFAGVVIETLPGMGPEVARQLANCPDIELEGGDGEQRLAAVWRAESGEDLERQIETLLASSPSIVGVFPTFVGNDAV
ncbi:MAG: hypothetical protein ACYC7A_04310 [Thermoanaerobaculia bacterium]